MTQIYKKPFWKLSGIQRALLLFVVLPIMTVVALGLGYGLEKMNTQETERLKDDLELLGRAIRVPVGEALMSDDEDAVQNSLDSVFEIGRVYGASVFDVNGNQIAAAGLAERDLTQSRVAREVVMTGEQQERYREISGVSMYSTFVPVFDNIGQPNGFIQINRRASDFDATFVRLSKVVWSIWGVMAVLTLFIVIFGHYGGVGRHVNALKLSMNRVEQGERKHRADESGPSEIADVARGLNQMLDSIERKDSELEAHRLQEQKLAEQLQRQERMAAIGRVASGVAHELGAPLTVIDGRARRLLKQDRSDDEIRQLEAIRGQVQRLTRIVQQLLSYSRSDSDEPHQVALHKQLHDSIESTGHETDDKAPAVVTGDLQPSWVIGDESRIELALVNVVRNAIQAARSEVQISLRHENNQAVIAVRDDGAGLPAGITKDKLLEPFFTTKEQGKGTGLGLAIVDNVLVEHHGQLEIHNHQNGGCEVVMRFPLRPEPKLEQAKDGVENSKGASK